jgi:hypothetical protein
MQKKDKTPQNQNLLSLKDLWHRYRIYVYLKYETNSNTRNDK